MNRPLDNQVAVVTGAARGIGLAIATKLSEAGAHVVLSDVDAPAAEEAAAALDGVEALACDVRDEEQVARLVEGVAERHGRLDVMVSNAGIATVNPLVEMALDEWRAVLAVNLDGVFLCTKHAARAMAANGGGAIINVASIKAFGGAPATAHYGAAKAGVVSLTKSAALELRQHGIRVNAICPGWVETDMVTARRGELESALGVDLGDVVAQLQGRLGTPDEVAGLAVFLASDRARFSSGSTFTADGGATASLI